MPKMLLYGLWACVLALGLPAAHASDTPATPSLLGDGYGIDHSMHLVRDLAQARDHFVDVLGFRMPPVADAGRHRTGTYNVTAAFADLSYIELLAVHDADAVATHRPHFLRFLDRHEGIRGIALSTSSADGTHRWLQQQGFAVNAPYPGWIDRDGTERDSDQPDWWIVTFAGDAPPPELPFFVQYRRMPYTEIKAEWDEGYTELRQVAQRQHPNGALGLLAVEVAVHDIAKAEARFRRMGLQPVEGEHSGRFHLGRNQLVLRAAVEADDDVARFLDQRGEGISGLHIEVIDLAATQAWLAQRLPEGVLQAVDEGVAVPAGHAYGARLVFVQESAQRRPNVLPADTPEDAPPPR